MANLVSTSTDRAYRWEGFAFNGLCAVYFLTLGPIVTEAGFAAMHEEETRVIWLGVLLIAIMLVEIYAFPKKMRYVRQAVQEHGDSMGAGFLLWMFHAVISIILLFLVAGCFGVKIEEDSELPGWMMVAIPVTVIKELGFLMCLIIGRGDEEEKDVRYNRPNRKEWVLDLILIAYACIAYSVTWSVITKNVSMERDNPVMFGVNLFVSFLLFLIFYLPLRIPYWLEEIARVKTGRDVAMLVGSILLVYIPAIWGLG